MFKRTSYLALILCLIAPLHANAVDFGTNTRSAIDVSTRANEFDSHAWSNAAIGLDLHRVFTSGEGDIGTLVFQPYVVRIDDPPVVPGLFDDDHDWALQWRIANFNYTALAQGRFNVRVGHFELPFGLEQVVQTNGTLYQVNTPSGLKADWGVSVNGATRHFEYEVARMTGSGNDLDIDDSSLLVGRLGTPTHRLAWIGLSWMDGEQQAAGGPVDRRRWAVDTGLLLPLGFGLRAEYVRALAPDQPANHLYTELRWQNPRESLHLHGQWRRTRTDGLEAAEAQTFTVGLRYEPNARWSLSGQASRPLVGPDFGNRYSIQLRYRFQDVL